MKIQTVMTHKKETKGTVVYINDTDGAPVSQLYVQKSVMKQPYPETIMLTLESDDE